MLDSAHASPSWLVTSENFQDVNPSIPKGLTRDKLIGMNVGMHGHEFPLSEDLTTAFTAAFIEDPTEQLYFRRRILTEQCRRQWELYNTNFDLGYTEEELEFRAYMSMFLMEVPRFDGEPFLVPEAGENSGVHSFNVMAKQVGEMEHMLADYPELSDNFAFWQMSQIKMRAIGDHDFDEVIVQDMPFARTVDTDVSKEGRSECGALAMQYLGRSILEIMRTPKGTPERFQAERTLFTRHDSAREVVEAYERDIVPQTKNYNDLPAIMVAHIEQTEQAELTDTEQAILNTLIQNWAISEFKGDHAQMQEATGDDNTMPAWLGNLKFIGNSVKASDRNEGTAHLAHFAEKEGAKVPFHHFPSRRLVENLEYTWSNIPPQVSSFEQFPHEQNEHREAAIAMLRESMRQGIRLAEKLVKLGPDFWTNDTDLQAEEATLTDVHLNFHNGKKQRAIDDFCERRVDEIKALVPLAHMRADVFRKEDIAAVLRYMQTDEGLDKTLEYVLDHQEKGPVTIMDIIEELRGEQIAYEHQQELIS